MNAPLQEQVAAMPVGIFVWQSELHALVDEINSLLPVDAPHGLVPQPIDLNLHPLLTDAETSLVFAGFVRAVGISVLPASSQGVRSGLTTPEELLTQFSLAHDPANKGAVPYPTTKVVERPLTKLEQDKLEAQHIAQTQWLHEPNLSIETIARSAAMRHLKRLHPGKNTIRGWIAEVDTRPPERRRGRRRGSTSI